MQEIQYMLIPGEDIRTYCNRVCTLPILSIEEEQKLAKSYYDDNNLESAQKLILHHLRFVIYVAQQYEGYGLPMEDIIQEGTVGLMKSVKSFDPHKGYKLSTYAQRWIRSEIYSYVIANIRSYKIATTKNQHKLFFNIKGYLAESDTLTPELAERIAEDLDVKVHEVYEMAHKLDNTDASLSHRVNDNGDEVEIFNLESSSPNPEDAVIEEDERRSNVRALYGSLDELPARTRDIVERRQLREDDVPTLQVLSKEYGVSIERIRQIEAQGLKKIKETLTA